MGLILLSMRHFSGVMEILTSCARLIAIDGQVEFRAAFEMKIALRKRDLDALSTSESREMSNGMSNLTACGY